MSTKKLQDILTSNRGLIILFILAHVTLMLMMIWTFPVITAGIEPTIFDLSSSGYSIADARTIIKSLDPSATAFYLFPQIWFLDILYPLLLAIFLSACLYRFLISKSSNIYDRYKWLIVLPWITMLVDYTENVLISIMITQPVSDELIVTSSYFTMIKSISTSISWTIVLILFFNSLFRRKA